MSYPDLPNNRLIVNGVDLSIRFQMVLLDGYTLEPPEPKTYTVDIPGGNGVIDLTEALTGDVAYKNRQQEFTFAVIDVKNFEKVKTEVSNFLHGRAFDYTMTMDPGYTYHGRFSVDSYSHEAYANGLLGQFKITVDANPYKLREATSLLVDCAGGKWLELTSARKSEYPKISVSSNTIVSYYDKNNTLQNIQLEPGVYIIRSFKVSNQTKRVYINSKRFYTVSWNDVNVYVTVRSDKWDSLSKKTWTNMASDTWGFVGKGESYLSVTWDAAKKFTWDNIHYQKLGATEFVRNVSWIDMRNQTWSEAHTKTWGYYTKNVDTFDSKVLIEYDMEDL